MNWLVWLGLAVLMAVIAAVTGAQPKGARPVTQTRLMGVARVVFLIMIGVFLYLAYRTRSGG
jgi:hypothetical protein